MIGGLKERLIVLIILILVVIVTGSKFSDTRDAEIDRLLKKLNKPALKSIKSPDGDIIDCVSLKNHPIYDNPLFKNHTIQMRPSSYQESQSNVYLNTEKQSSIVTQLWTVNGRCPKNSIPIRRTRREDILRAESIEKYGKKDPKNAGSCRNNCTHEYAIVRVRRKVHGAKATINVWKPYVQTTREFSLAQIWLVAGPVSELNTVEAGWQVFPDYYGDSNPRYFTYWTANGYRGSGCYNLDCDGFVNIHPEFALGAALSDVSTYEGGQYNIPTTIWKDPHFGHWWLKLYDHIYLGYWPSSLFNHLNNGADEVQWGGEIIDYKDGSQHTTTKMGSGHFAEEGWAKASYFRNIEIKDECELIWRIPRTTYSSMTDESCYNVKPGNNILWGNFFFYGGPGRNPNCR